ncbi:unnamed protein product [Enterobius vermicularis]|uniref:receptor protein-tyrosine kinase n=1 Tax=Enterobius vermicularis TaxID=51028 RepID=A0A0N4UYT0_ENTVE|nr:unnamed protein product [Enterobius vermicularis]
MWAEETYITTPLGNLRAYVACNSERSLNDDGELPLTDDWLYTPRIERQEAKRILINVTFTVRSCRDLGDLKGCKETFKLYGTQVSNGEKPLQDGSDKNWELINVIAGDPHSGNDAQSPASSVVRSFPVTKDAVYFAFRVEGACISLLSVQVFYEVCPEITQRFTHFPKTVTGSELDSIISVNGQCVDNASPTGCNLVLIFFLLTADTSRNPTYVCKGTGKWELRQGECECNAGYAPSSDSQSCTVCPDGLYKPRPGASNCKRCPRNTRSSGKQKSVCECDFGYYRAVTDSADSPCTKPPTKPTDLKIASRNTEDSVVLEWNEPVSLGGRKELWYRVKCSDCPSSTRYSPNSLTLTERRLEISGLESNRRYSVKIFAENDVSQFVPVGQSHYAIIDVETKPFSPMLVDDFRIDGIQDNGVTISWKPPAVMARENLEYEVETRHNGTFFHNKTALLYFTVPNLDPHVRYSFKVRVKTRNDEYGNWSKPLWYQVGHGVLPGNAKIDDLSSNTPVTSIESFWSGGFPIFGLILFIFVLTFFFAFIFIIRSMRSKSNRKHFSDCDGLDSYKNGTLTPDYNTPPHPGIMQSFFRGKLGAPLIQYGSHHSSACYCSARFKPYVDPTAYEDPNQALLEFANDVDPNLIRITEVIGSGEFGEVCKGVLQPSPKIAAYDFQQAKTIAIKTLKPGSSDKAKADFLMEASIMGQFEHENVIRLIGVVTKSEPVMIVTEFMENGSLDQFLRKHDDGQLQIVQILDMLRGIAAGMKYLTEKGFVHRDLAARNVLVDAQLTCKIADFGLSRGLEGSVEQEYTTNGGKIPVRWTAPEAITHRKFTAASDVWSFGVVMWEVRFVVCSFGERPYWEWTNQKVISEITIGYRLPAPMDTPTSLHVLMLRCWDIDRHRRPTFAQILQTLEEYCRHPDLVYVDSGALESAANISYGIGKVTGAQGDPGDGKIPSPPACMPPPVPLYDFLKRAGLSHYSTKLHLAGLQSVSDLTRLNHIDLLSYGFNAEEAQRLHKLIATMQRTLPRQIDRQHYPPNAQTAAALAHCRIANAAQTISTTTTTTTAANCDGFFV